jgi:VanZ family protein
LNKPRILAVSAGWALVATVIWLSVTPQPIQTGIDQGDKLGHLLAYGSLMFWFCVLYRPLRVRAFYAAGFIAMGIALEFVQGWLGYRSFEVADIVANTVGVALGFALPSMIRALR